MHTAPTETAWEVALESVHRGDDDALRLAARACLDGLHGAHPVPGAGEPYGRRLLLEHARGEVMLASWRHGAACAPHDHGRSRGRVVVLAGQFLEVRFAASTRGLRTLASRAVAAGDVLQVEEGLVHEMRAAGEGLTLHVYVPCGSGSGGARGMRVYDRAARAVLVVAEGCGAWVPGDPAQVLERHPWDAPRGEEGGPR